jgi:hypothetical protein
MKKTIFLAGLMIVICSNAQSVELVCKGEQQRNPNQRPVMVDCSDRKAVIDMLGISWKALRKEGIGGSMEDMCWNPFNKAKEIHPSIDMRGIAPTFFMQCNIALEYVK